MITVFILLIHLQIRNFAFPHFELRGLLISNVFSTFTRLKPIKPTKPVYIHSLFNQFQLVIQERLT